MTDFVIASITDYGKNRGLESDKRQSLCSTSSKGGLMKHISIIFVLLLTGICCSAQEKPKELTFLNTRFVEGASKEELYSRGNKWTHYRDERDGIYGASGYDSSKPVEYFHIVQECPNFGVSKYFSRYGSAIHFNIKIVCRDGSYTAEISRIEAWLNPDLGIKRKTYQRRRPYGGRGYRSSRNAGKSRYRKRQNQHSRLCGNYCGCN